MTHTASTIWSLLNTPITPIYAKFNVRHTANILFLQGCQKFPGTSPPTPVAPTWVMVLCFPRMSENLLPGWQSFSALGNKTTPWQLRCCFFTFFCSDCRLADIHTQGFFCINFFAWFPNLAVPWMCVKAAGDERTDFMSHVPLTCCSKALMLDLAWIQFRRCPFIDPGWVPMGKEWNWDQTESWDRGVLRCPVHRSGWRVIKVRQQEMA